MMPVRARLILCLCHALCVAAAARADSLVSLQFKGYVNHVVGNPFSFGLSGGEPFSALFTYDPATPAANSGTAQTLYFQSTHYDVSVAAHSFTPVANDWFVFMSNDAGGGDFITFSAGSYPAGYGTIAIDNHPNTDAGFIIYLLDTTGTVWNSVALPRSPFPSFSAFDNRDITTFADNRLGQMAETFQVTLTGMQQVPEPGTACLMTLGVLGLVVACRRGLCGGNFRIESWSGRRDAQRLSLR